MSTEWSKQACPSRHSQQREGLPPRAGGVQPAPPGACTALPPQAPASGWLCPPSKPPVRLFHHCLRSRPTTFSGTPSQHTLCPKPVSAFLMWPVPAGLQSVSEAFLPRSHFWSPQNQTRSPTIYRGSHPNNFRSQSQRLLTNPSTPGLAAEGVLAQVCTR